MPRTLVAAVCLFALLGLPTTAQSPTPQAQPPRFRAGVDLMRIDVTVLDKKTRKPVTGLTAEDFDVKVSGTPQPIQAVAEVDTRVPVTTGVAWQVTAARDVVANAISATRLIVIVMDDEEGGLWHRQAAKRVGHKIIDELGQDDLAAVVYVGKSQFSQDFTTDRSLLHASVDRFDSPERSRFAFHSAPGTIKNVRTFLSKVAKYRRAIMVITSRGYDLDTGPSMAWGFLRDAVLNDEDPDASVSDNIEPASRLGHVPVYFFTTFGLTVSTNPLARKTGDDTITLARYAGGRAIVENNAPEAEVASVMDELGSLYTLAYAPTFPFDGKQRYADIKVNRPDVVVLPSSGAFRTAHELSDTDPARKVNLTKGFGLLDAVAAPMMEGALPLRLSTVVTAVKGVHPQAVAVTLGLPAPDAAKGPQQYGLTMVVYDGEGRQELFNTRKVVTVTPGVGPVNAPAEVLLRLDLRPGRYNIRVAAEPAGGGPAGSVFTSLLVPDFAKERLSMSGVAMGWAEGRPIGGREAVAAILPFAPTVVREFTVSDRVGALVRVHQGTGRAEPVRLETQVIDTGDTVVASQVTVDVAEHRYELPLRSLKPGEYLLRFTATAGQQRVMREVRFSIR